MSNRSIARIASLAVLLALAGCGDNSVGNDLKFNNRGDTGGAAIGEPSPSPSPAVTPTRVAITEPSPARSVVPSQKPAPSQTQTAQFGIKINGYNAPNQLDPYNAQVSVGTIVSWTNADSTSHSITASGGAFTSGNLPPGGVYRWRAGPAGTYSYCDDTRPSVCGTIKVV